MLYFTTLVDFTQIYKVHNMLYLINTQKCVPKLINFGANYERLKRKKNRSIQLNGFQRVALKATHIMTFMLDTKPPEYVCDTDFLIYYKSKICIV